MFFFLNSVCYWRFSSFFSTWSVPLKILSQEIFSSYFILFFFYFTSLVDSLKKHTFSHIPIVGSHISFLSCKESNIDCFPNFVEKKQFFHYNCFVKKMKNIKHFCIMLQNFHEFIYFNPSINKKNRNLALTMPQTFTFSTLENEIRPFLFLM